MRLAQITDENGKRALVVTARGESRLVKGARTTAQLAEAAIEAGTTLKKLIAERGVGKPVDLTAAYKEGRVLTPVDHPDPAHLYVTGTGLTHLGSAEGRDKMHKKLEDPSALTDSMKMFKMGLEGGKPGKGKEGVQPEWFYKGDGSTLAAPGGDLSEPRLRARRRRGAGDRRRLSHRRRRPAAPARLRARQRVLRSRHRAAELSLSRPFEAARLQLRPGAADRRSAADVQGVSRIRRGKAVLWEKPFLSGEQNMSHTIANLEAHHFKYALFRRPGDVHVHFFGTATLSFSDGIKPEKGDVFEIEAEPFGLPLRNRLTIAKAAKTKVTAL